MYNVIPENTFEKFVRMTDDEVAKISASHTRKRCFKAYTYMLELVNSQCFETLDNLRVGTTYRILTYNCTNIGSNHYQCWVRTWYTTYIKVLKETKYFYKIETGKIAKDKILAVINEDLPF